MIIQIINHGNQRICCPHKRKTMEELKIRVIAILFTGIVIIGGAYLGHSLSFLFGWNEGVTVLSALILLTSLVYFIALKSEK